MAARCQARPYRCLHQKYRVCFVSVFEDGLSGRAQKGTQTCMWRLRGHESSVLGVDTGRHRVLWWFHRVRSRETRFTLLEVIKEQTLRINSRKSKPGVTAATLYRILTALHIGRTHTPRPHLFMCIPRRRNKMEGPSGFSLHVRPPSPLCNTKRGRGLQSPRGMFVADEALTTY